jgi:hypothetical protein
LPSFYSDVAFAQAKFLIARENVEKALVLYILHSEVYFLYSERTFCILKCTFFISSVHFAF